MFFLYRLSFMMVFIFFVLSGCKQDAPQAEPEKRNCPFNAIKEKILEIKCNSSNINTCIEGCEGDGPLSAQYCYKATIFFHAKHDELNLRKFISLGCQKGDSFLCSDLADTYVYKLKNPSLPYDNPNLVPFENFKKYAKIRQEMMPLIEKRCKTEKDGKSCHVLSEHYDNNWPPAFVKPDPSKGEFNEIVFVENLTLSLDYMKLACEYGFRSDCLTLASIYSGKYYGNRWPVNYDKDKAKFYYACDCENRDLSMYKKCEPFEEYLKK